MPKFSYHRPFTDAIIKTYARDRDVFGGIRFPICGTLRHVLGLYCIHYTVYSIRTTVYCIHYTVYSIRTILYTLYSIQY